jgi:hypothetical protein
MDKKWVGGIALTSFRVVYATCGWALVLSAFSGTALAFRGDAPEIDPGSAGNALALLAGGVLLLMGRCRQK